MAHTIGTITARRSTTSNPDTSTVVVLAGETVLTVLIKTVGGTDRAGGSLTWGPYTLTQANTTQKAASSPEASAELWYLVNPIPGSATLTIPNTGGRTMLVTIVRAGAASGGTSKFSAANGANNTSANPSPGAVTITDAGAFVVAVVASGATTWAPSAQVGTIIANTDDGTDGGGEQYALSPALGSFTLSWTQASDDWGAVVAAFNEVPPHGVNNYERPKCVSAGVVSAGGIG
jgi:hypothetical protein